MKLAVNLSLNVLPARYQLFRARARSQGFHLRGASASTDSLATISATFPDLAEIYLPTNRCLPPSLFHRLFRSCSPVFSFLTTIYISHRRLLRLYLSQVITLEKTPGSHRQNTQPRSIHSRLHSSHPVIALHLLLRKH